MATSIPVMSAPPGVNSSTPILPPQPTPQQPPIVPASAPANVPQVAPQVITQPATPQVSPQVISQPATPQISGVTTADGSPFVKGSVEHLDSIVQQMAANGEPDSNIQAVVDDFKQKYGLPDSSQPEPPKTVTGFLGNAVTSTGDVLKNTAVGLADILNPNPQQNTVVNVAKILGGLLEVPFKLATGGQIHNQPFQNFIQNLADRYGSWDKFENSLYKDPAGVLLDLSSILDPAAKGVGLLGDTLDASDAATMAAKTNAAGIAAATDNPMLRVAATQFAGGANTVSKAGEIASQVAEAANPLNAAIKPAQWVKAGLENLAPKLEEANLRLTPTQRVNFASKLNDVTQYIAKNLPSGSPEARYEAILKKSTDMENKVQNLLTNDAKGVTVPRDNLVSSAESLKSEFAGQRDALEIDKQIDGFKTLLQAKYPDQIPVTDLNTLKRSTFESAFNAAGTKVSDAVEFRLGDLLYDNLKQATNGLGSKSLEQLNKEYTTVITAKKLLKTAMGRPQVGFVDKIATSIAGGIVGHAFGGPAGSAVGGLLGKTISDHIPTTAIKSILGKTATKAAKGVPSVSGEAASAIGATTRLGSFAKPPAPAKRRLGSPNRPAKSSP